jgi:hypothetical protein
MEKIMTKLLLGRRPSARPDECARLICKLHWIGLDEDARPLQRELRTVPAEERPTVSAGPFSTD